MSAAIVCGVDYGLYPSTTAQSLWFTCYGCALAFDIARMSDREFDSFRQQHSSCRPIPHGHVGEHEVKTAFGPLRIKADSTLKPGEIVFAHAAPVDPLDVEHEGVMLRQLLSHDEMWRKDEWPDAWVAAGRNKLTPAQRAAVSAHWSAELRAKVAASAEDDKARRPSVMVEVDD